MHATQHEVMASVARFLVLACGRRWGKTRLATVLCMAKALERGRAWWVAPTYKVASIGWRMLKAFARQIPGTEIREVDRMITYPSGGTVQAMSADNPDSLRGEGLDFCALDECAFMKEEAWSAALRPALADRQGKAIFISTPKGRNWFWKLYQAAKAGKEGWAAWSHPTSANPYIPTGEIEDARGELPERIFRQEFLAEFLEGEGVVFRNINACLYPGEETPEDHHGHNIVMGVDWGKDVDYTALSVICATCAKEVALERFHAIEYRLQRHRLEALAERWAVSFILAESNAMGEPIIEELQWANLPVEGFATTAATKPPLIESLVLAFEREECQWLADPVATVELEGYERAVNATTGRPTYAAPKSGGLHDDTVMARALGWRAAVNSGPWAVLI